MKEMRGTYTRKKQRGVALLLTLFAFMLLGIVVFGTVAITLAHSRSTQVFKNSHAAFYVARTGLYDAMDRIEDLYRTSEYAGGTCKPIVKKLENGSYTYEIWAPPGNDTNSYKIWRITSTGTVNNVKRKLTAWVDMQSFAEFTYCSDQENRKKEDGTPITRIKWSSTASVQGPVHSNSYFFIMGNPKFSDKVTSSNSDDPNYDKNLNKYKVYDTRKNPQLLEITTDPKKFYRRGDPNRDCGTDYKDNRPVPLNNSPDFSFCGAAPKLSFPKELINARKNAKKSYDTDITVYFQPGGITKVELDNGDGTITTEYFADKELTLYTKGNINIRGDYVPGKEHKQSVVQGLITLCASEHIHIKDNIFYQNKYRDALGLMTENGNIYIDPERKGDFTIEAVLMAPNGTVGLTDTQLGLTKSVNHSDGWGQMGKFTLFGGITQSYRYFLHDGSDGYEERDYIYDPKMSYFTPPNYPLTGNVKIFSISDSAAPGR